jgi:nitroreductase/FMN reductase [NAD(P)H]
VSDGTDAAALWRARYGTEPDFAPPAGIVPGLAAILDRRVTRRYRPELVPEPLLRTLLAAAQSAPSKSDLQQYSIVVVQDPAKIALVADWIDTMAWLRRRRSSCSSAATSAAAGACASCAAWSTPTTTRTPS